MIDELLGRAVEAIKKKKKKTDDEDAETMAWAKGIVGETPAAPVASQPARVPVSKEEEDEVKALMGPSKRPIRVRKF